jgi:hypothetical protein
MQNRHSMKYVIFPALFLFVFSSSHAQTGDQSLAPFREIIASPRISVVLQKGETESIRLVCNNIPVEKVNVLVKGKVLHLYLDHAKITERQVSDFRYGHHGRRSIYAGVTVTAYVTYTQLRAVEIRGAGELSCDTRIVSKKFKLRAYGENEIRLAFLKTRKFKTSLYGENHVRILSGEAEQQVYRLFGENKIDTQGLESATASARIFGEGKLNVNVSDEVRLTALGENTIAVTGNPVISKGIVIGRASVSTQH